VTRAVLSAVLLTAACSLPALDYVWWEGESPSASSGGLKAEHWFNSPHERLSGGKSLGGNSDAQTWLEYVIDAPRAGEYSFFIRKFWQHGPFRYRWNSTGEWVEVKNTALLDTVKLNEHSINWVPGGKVTLLAGANTLRIEALEAGKPFVLDCFVVVNGPFSPNGLLKPGEKFNKAEPGTWSFEPDIDGYDKPDALGLRALNERVAGENGWLTTNAQGDIADGTGRTMRIWAVNTNIQARGIDDVRAQARHLAKRGVNMVRHHAHINSPKANLDAGPNDEQIDELHKLVAGMKDEGIYTTFSPYWANFSGAPPQTMLFWDERVQAAYKSWVKEALTRPNPYDAKKTPLAKDPALAIFQIQNEDSLFFWTTMHALKGDNLTRITAKYHAWRKANGLQGEPQLNFKFWELGNPNQDHQDTMRFFAETMRAWNTEVERWLRDDIGCKAMVNAGNWRTADQVRLLDLERWSYDANAVIGVNRYVGGVHVCPKKKEQAGYMVQAGDLFTDQSKTIDWESLATNARQVAGKSYIIPESTWVSPGSHHSEGPFLVAAYSALTGVDAYYWFALGQVGFDSTVVKWQAASPVLMGGWPAAAWMFRKDLVTRGKPVVHEERALDDMWKLRSPLLAEEAGFDPNRDTSISEKSNIRSTVDPAAYLVGPVEVKYGGDPTKSVVVDLTGLLDKDAKKATSITKELVMDWGNGLCTLDAAGAAGATGFLAKAGTIRLKSLSITAKNDYATVMAVALDGKPLTASKKVLVQITTQNRPYGWRTSPTTFTNDKKEYQGYRIDAVGEAPWNVVDTDLVITLANTGLRTAVRLDENLYPTSDPVAATVVKDGLVLTPAKNTMYLLVQ
jgi:hypothetical protein